MTETARFKLTMDLDETEGVASRSFELSHLLQPDEFYVSLVQSGAVPGEMVDLGVFDRIDAMFLRNRHPSIDVRASFSTVYVDIDYPNAGNVSFLNTNPDTLTVTPQTLVNDGFKGGTTLRLFDRNVGTYLIDSVSVGAITLDAAENWPETGTQASSPVRLRGEVASKVIVPAGGGWQFCSRVVPEDDLLLENTTGTPATTGSSVLTETPAVDIWILGS